VTSPKLIRDEIITLIEAADPQNASKKGVTKWFKGEPPKSRWPGFPWGWVEWGGGQMNAPVGSIAEIKDLFYIVVVDKHIESDRAEDSIMDFAESIEAVLDDSPTIGGLVSRSYVVNREKQKVFDADYSVCACRITLQTHRRE
jgi:hypothetical protein